ncbi:hypothetical protein TASCI_10208 [Tenacibaculum ascidiaceicola]
MYKGFLKNTYYKTLKFQFLTIKNMLLTSYYFLSSNTSKKLQF